MTPQLWKPFQEDGVQWLMTHPHGLLFDDLGLGKTVQVVTALERLRVKGPKLVLCSRALMGEWADTIRLWAPNLSENIITLGRSGPTRRERLAAVLSDGHGWVLLNREALSVSTTTRHKDKATGKPIPRKGPTYPVLPVLRSIPWAAVVADEAHHFRDRRSSYTRALLALQAPIQWALTATPMDGKPYELWPMFRWMQPNGFASFWAFARRFCIYEQNYFTRFAYVCPNPAEVKALKNLLSYWSLRRLKQDVLPQLPRLVRRELWVDLSTQERTWYLEMANAMLAYLDANTTVAAPIALAQMTRLKQLATCAAVFGGPQVSTKVDTVMELIGNWPPEYKGVVASYFRQVANRVVPKLEALGRGVVSLVGGMAQLQLAGTVNAFRHDPKVNTLVMTAQTGGEGINLEMAQHLILTDLPWSSIQLEQLVNRIHRGTSKHSSVQVTFILARDTIDEVIWTNLKNKTKVNDETLVKQLYQNLATTAMVRRQGK